MYKTLPGSWKNNLLLWSHSVLWPTIQMFFIPFSKLLRITACTPICLSAHWNLLYYLTKLLWLCLLRSQATAISKFSISKGYFSVFTYGRQLDFSAIDYLLLKTWLPWSPCHHIFLSTLLCQSLLFACFLCVTIQYCPGIEFYLTILHLCSGFIYNCSSRIMFANKFQVPIIDLDSLLEIKIHMLNYKMCNSIRINIKSSNSIWPKQKLFIPPLNLSLFLYLLFSLW